MYNSIYPININYRKQNISRTNQDEQSSSAQIPVSDNNNQNKKQNTFPNGTKVAIDYTKGQINISQVLTDFRSTILAINAPQDVSEEVNMYLNLVDKESKKENPSREIVLANLKNASRISDAYIAKSLNKPSNVVEGWIDALFLQKINIKANPDEINPDFLLEFPQKAQAKIDAAKKEQLQEQTAPEQNQFQIQPESAKKAEQIVSKDEQAPNTPQEISIHPNIQQQEKINIESDLEISDSDTKTDGIKITYVAKTPFSPINELDDKAKALFTQAKKQPDTNQGDTEAINLLNEALGILSQSEEINENIKAAIHFERGKIFDSYDYVDYALRDYWEATKADDLNLKAKAFYKSGQIYDEFKEYSPALDNYLSSVAYSGEADNSKAQACVLSKIASLFTKQYDIENTQNYSDLAIETAITSNSDKTIAKTYSSTAQNYQYLGENDKAIDSYKNALAVFSRTNESPEEIAHNYEQAAIVMEKLGNHAKAVKLQLKANRYYQIAQQQQEPLEQAG